MELNLATISLVLEEGKIQDLKIDFTDKLSKVVILIVVNEVSMEEESICGEGGFRG